MNPKFICLSLVLLIFLKIFEGSICVSCKYYHTFKTVQPDDIHCSRFVKLYEGSDHKDFRRGGQFYSTKPDVVKAVDEADKALPLTLTDRLNITSPTSRNFSWKYLTYHT